MVIDRTMNECVDKGDNMPDEVEATAAATVAEADAAERSLPPEQPWREIETNERPLPVYSNRVATYATITEIGMRFLSTCGLSAGSARYEDKRVLEITNVANVMLAPMIAKRLIVDLQRAVDFVERQTGQKVLDWETAARLNKLGD
jgi:hypothetical protein